MRSCGAFLHRRAGFTKAPTASLCSRLAAPIRRRALPDEAHRRRSPPVQERLQFYIGGRWVEPSEPRALDVLNPATEEVIGRIALGGPKDVDLAVAAARDAFESYSQTTREERLALLERIVTAYQARYEDLAK